MKFSSNADQYVHNFQNVKFNKTELETLPLGNEFRGSKEKVNKTDFEIQFENLYAQTPEPVTS